MNEEPISDIRRRNAQMLILTKKRDMLATLKHKDGKPAKQLKKDIDKLEELLGFKHEESITLPEELRKEMEAALPQYKWKKYSDATTKVDDIK